MTMLIVVSLALLAAVPAVLVYMYIALCIRAAGVALRPAEPWRAWVPGLNVLYLCNLVDVSGAVPLLLIIADLVIRIGLTADVLSERWMFAAIAVEVVLTAIFMFVWRDVAAALGRPRWLGVVTALPGIGLLTMWKTVSLRGHVAALLAMTFVTIVVALPHAWPAFELHSMLLATRSSDASRRLSAVSDLSRINDMRAQRAIVHALGDSDVYVRRRAILAVTPQSPGIDRHVPALLQMRQDPDVGMFVDDLIRSLGSRSIPYIAEALGRANESNEKEDLLELLAKMPYSARAAVPRIAVLARDEDAAVQKAAADLLVRIDPETAARVFIERLADGNYHDLTTLASLPSVPADVVPHLAPHLRDGGPATAEAAARICTVVGPAAAPLIPELEALANESSGAYVDARAAAQRALEAIRSGVR